MPRLFWICLPRLVKHHCINMSQLKFFETRDAELGESDTAPEPLLGHDGVMHYEIKHICKVTQKSA